MDNEIIIVLFATFFVLLLLIYLINFILSYQNRNLAFKKEKEIMQIQFEQTLFQSQVEVQEATYSILAKELHDNVGQLLSSSKMLLGITQRNPRASPETLTLAEETLGKAITELRALSKSLDKEWLEQFDLIENLTTEINRINAGKMLSIDFSHSGKLPLTSEKQIILFRIIQEGLQNIIKHAQAKNINLEIKTGDLNLSVHIHDDGKGFSEISGNGLGIRNMKHRAKLLGGTITWSQPETGSSVTIEIPIIKSEL